MVALKIVDQLFKQGFSTDLLLEHLVNVAPVGAKVLRDRTGIPLIPSLEITGYERVGFNFFHEFRQCTSGTD